MQFLITLAALVLLFQTVHCFCIYNMFDDKSYFTITDARVDVRADKIFTKEMRPGDVSCCHYSNKDCSSDGKDDEVNSFHTYFFFPNTGTGSKRTLTHCTTGGALVFSGTFRKISVECKFANGTTTPVEMTIDELKHSDMFDRVN